MTDQEAKRLSPESYPEIVVTDEKGPNNLPTAMIYADDWERLGEYSCTMPTGVFYGKRWKRNINAYNPNNRTPNWVIGGYDPHDDPTQASIVWYDVLTVERQRRVERGRRAVAEQLQGQEAGTP